MLRFFAPFLFAFLLSAPAIAAPLLRWQPGTTSSAWLAARVPEVLENRLQLLGFAFAQHPEALTLSLKVSPAEARMGTTPVRVELKASRAGKRLFQAVRQAPAEQLDTLADTLALELTQKLSPQAPPSQAASGTLALFALPFAAHRLLGQAALRLEAEEFVQAMVLYDRVGRLFKNQVIMEAIEGRRRCMALMQAKRGGQAPDRSAQIDGAKERAQVAENAKNWKLAIGAWKDVLRYGVAQTRPFRVALPTEYLAERLFWVGDQGLLFSKKNQENYVFDSSSGYLKPLPPAKNIPVAYFGGEKVSLFRGLLYREEQGGPRRWQLKLPAEAQTISAVGPGHLALHQNKQLRWIDASFGKMGKLWQGEQILSLDSEGVLVRSKPQEVAFLKPGKKAPSWRYPFKGSLKAAGLTSQRAWLQLGEQLLLLRLENGRLVKKPVPLQKGERIVSAQGRYALLQSPNYHLRLLDILGVRLTAEFAGPSRALAAYFGSESATIVFESQDLLSFHRDGALKDRALAYGRPLKLYREEGFGGPVLLRTEEGLEAYRAWEPEGLRDVDVWLRLAQLELKRGRAKSALKLATQLAAHSSGSVAEVEALRAQILGKMTFKGAQQAAKEATQRAKIARQPQQALPSFRL